MNMFFRNFAFLKKINLVLSLFKKNIVKFRDVIGFRFSKAHRAAFSLIEVAVVIVIIGILISGIVLSRKLVADARLKTAVSITQSSPVPGIRNGVLWLETSLSNSFSNAEIENGDAITSWTDQNPSSNKTTVSVVGTGPQYSNSINGVHAVKFDGSTDNYLKTGSALINNVDYTIFVTEKRQGDSNNNFFLTSNDDSFAVGYSDTATIIHRHSSELSYESKITSYAESEDEARIFTFVQDSVNGKSTYINGILAGQDAADTAQLSGIESLSIGKGYTGEIGEVVIFARALRDEERKSVEDYLGKKWERSVNRDLVANASCLNGVVTNGGCSTDCYVSIPGVSSPLTLSHGDSNMEATCGQTGYDVSSSVFLSCSNGNVTATGSCDADTAYVLDDDGVASLAQGAEVDEDGNLNSAPTGYQLNEDNELELATGFALNDDGDAELITGYELDESSGTASLITGYTLTGSSDGVTPVVATGYEIVEVGSAPTPIQCNLDSEPGILPTTVDYGTDSVTCNDTANNYAGYINYNCLVDGSLTITGACSCATGYAGSSCDSCDTESGYESDGEGSCVEIPQDCPGASVTGVVSPGDLTHGDTGISATCDSGYTGSVTLSCTDGTVAIDSGSCVEYVPQDCPAASLTGVVSPGDLTHGDTGISATCDSGYTGSVTLSCTDGTVAIDSGSCEEIPQDCPAASLTGVVSPGDLTHGDTGISATCDSGYTGSVTLACNDGTVSIDSGSCEEYVPQDCPAVSLTGVVSPGDLTHGDTGISATCDSGYTGSVTLSCNDGTVAIDSGSCEEDIPEDCPAASVTGVSSPGDLTHGDNGISATCASGYSGSVTLACNDGTVSIDSGNCCSGGVVTTSGGDHIHTFTSNGSFSCVSYPLTVRALIVGGGGAGGTKYGGGGGAGGLIHKTALVVSSSSSVSVGSGGVGNGAVNGALYDSTKGANGGDSSFAGLVASGGGGGGSSSNGIGATGGSGGGSVNASGGEALTVDGMDGNNGGLGIYKAGGGGGGAGGTGYAGATHDAGVGGAGLSFDISGSNIVYAAGGGGGGGTWPNTNSTGLGAAGDSCAGSGGNANSRNGGSAIASRGCGGGGGGYRLQNGVRARGAAGSGGSGVVIIRY